MVDFRKALKPGAQRCNAHKSGLIGYRVVLRVGRVIVWAGPHYAIRKCPSAAEARQRAIEHAECVLACDDGSLMAEELQEIAEVYAS